LNTAPFSTSDTGTARVEESDSCELFCNTSKRELRCLNAFPAF
jgi:hypothetical protein